MMPKSWISALGAVFTAFVLVVAPPLSTVQAVADRDEMLVKAGQFIDRLLPK